MEAKKHTSPLIRHNGCNFSPTRATMGAIKALHNVMIENQGVQNGYKSQKDEKGVKSRYLESYYPSSEAWRSKAINDARQMLLQAVKKYQEMDVEE